MKAMKWMLALVVMVLAVVSCSQKKEAPKSKVLVLYYSQTSNTKTVAQEIANKLGADIEEIFAPPMAAFLDQADLSGKKIVPFCTFGSGGLNTSVKELAAKQPKAEILPGYGVRAARVAAIPSEVDQFLKAGGFIEGEYVVLEDFPEQQPVSEEQSTAVDLPRETTAVQTTPPPAEMQIYVLALEGEDPVFTQVLR